MPDHLSSAQRRVALLEHEARFLSRDFRPFERRSEPRDISDPAMDLRAAQATVARLEAEVTVLRAARRKG
jgi:hypothetical protein